MGKQLCKYCGQVKDLEDFPIAGTIKGKVYKRKKCNTCYYAMKLARKNGIKNWFNDYKKTLCCSKCCENRWYVLDFHHTDESEKEENLGDAVRLGWSKEHLMEEIVKCIVLCSNCHRELHFLNK